MSGGGGSGEGRSVFGRLWARFGEVARSLGIVEEEDVRAALEHQQERKRARGPHKKIGEILVEKGKMGDGHVKKVLAEQKKVKSAATPKKKAKRKGKKTPAAKKKTKKAAVRVKKKAKKRAKKK